MCISGWKERNSKETCFLNCATGSVVGALVINCRLGGREFQFSVSPNWLFNSASPQFSVLISVYLLALSSGICVCSRKGLLELVVVAEGGVAFV